MASHNEISVGSTDWVVRVQGADVRVKVTAKNKKASGRGYDFSLRRLDSGGRVHGRTLTRGSGALRKPGTAVKAFGGTRAKPKAAAKKKPAAKPRAAKATAKNPPPAVAPLAATASRRRSAPAASASYSPPKLASLRGRGRPSAPSPRAAPARTKAKEGFMVNPKSAKVTKVIRALVKLGAEVSDFEVRNTVTTVLSELNTSSWR